MGKKYFISDLHIADRSANDEFYHENAFMNLVEKIIAEKDSQLIILGDFLELWQSRLEKVLFYYSDLFSKLFKLAAKDNLIYIYGNHDYIPFAKFKGTSFGNIEIKEEYIDRENGIWALHGHQFDDINKLKGKKKIKESLAEEIKDQETSKTTETYFKEKFKTQQDEFKKEVLKIQSHTIPRDKEGNKDLDRYRQKVYEGLQKKELNRGIIGHTHTAEVLELPNNKTYANPGSWTNPEQEPHYILVTDGEIKLKSVVDI